MDFWSNGYPLAPIRPLNRGFTVFVKGYIFKIKHLVSESVLGIINNYNLAYTNEKVEYETKDREAL
jgi:hypothetical protein